RTEGLTVRYLDEGSPQAPVLVLLHDGAFGSDAYSCWSTFIPRFTDRYRVVAPDFVGYGGSSKVFDFELDPRSQRLNGVTALLAALCIERAAFVGASFGGSVALVGAAAERLPMTAGVSISGTAGPFMNAQVFQRSHDYVPTPERAREL